MNPDTDRLYFKQLLSGRDFGNTDNLAKQMVNFVYLIGDQETGESRGFGFVTFDRLVSLDAAMEGYKIHRIDHKWIEVKLAEPVVGPDGKRIEAKKAEAAGGQKKTTTRTPAAFSAAMPPMALSLIHI